MHRGEIWWTDLPVPHGSEPGYRRPILIIQTDSFNQSAIRTIIGVSLSSNLELARSPGNVFLPKNQTRLPKDSVANVSQVATFDKRFLIECHGVLPSPLFHKVEEGLRLILGF